MTADVDTDEDEMEAAPWAIAAGLVEMRIVPVTAADGSVTHRRRLFITPAGMARLAAEIPAALKFD